MSDSSRKGIGGYFSDFRTNYLLAGRFVAGVILFLSPLFAWAVVNIGKQTTTLVQKSSDNLFALGGVEIFFALIIMMLAALIVLMDIAEYVSSLGDIKKQWFSDPLMEVVICAVILLFVFLATCKSVSSGLRAYISWIGGTAHRSIGCAFAWIGAIGVSVTAVWKLIKK